MRTDDLIEALAADNPPQRASVGRGLMLAAFGGGIITQKGLGRSSRGLLMNETPSVSVVVSGWKYLPSSHMA